MPDYDVWIDPTNKRVVVNGTICLREGQLEMFSCPKGTKEHEAIVAADTKAYAVHAALLAIGAQPGSPAQFDPVYKPAAGQEIEITVVWTDSKGNVHRDRAQDWILNAKTGKDARYPVGLRRQRLLDERSHRRKALPRRARRLHLRLQFRQRHARPADRKQPGQRRAPLPSLHRPHPPARHQSPPSPNAKGQKVGHAVA